MKARIRHAIIVAISILSTPATSQVERCLNNMSEIRDDLLLNSVISLQIRHPNIEFKEEGQPCRQSMHTIQSITRTFGTNHLKTISGYEYTKIINDSEYFTVERFKSYKTSSLRELSRALNRNKSRKLNIKENTVYEHFLFNDSIVIMISSATGKNENLTLFQEIREYFSSTAIAVP